MKEQIMPIQPIVDGRFVENKIVSKLLDMCQEAGYGLNQIAVENFTNEERMQFAQLIGYSLSGFADLSYVDDETYGAAEWMSKTVMTEDAARNQELRHQIGEARKGLRVAASALFRIHPDDLES